MNTEAPNAAEPMGPPMDPPSGGKAAPEFKQLMGHPRPLWMLFMTEFWERFAFYGIRWALVLYIVAQFYGGDASGQAAASHTYGAYLALVYAAAIFGGYIADRILGYQRSILLGAAIMAAGLFLIAVPNHQVFEIGLATVIVGNGMFKPIISTLVGNVYAQGDERRDSGFTIFYMGINLGAMIAPVLTGYLANKVFGSDAMPSYKVVFIASGIGMLVSLVWFWFGRRQLMGIGMAPAGKESMLKVLWVFIGAMVAIPVAFFLLASGATMLAWILGAMFAVLCLLLLVEGIREGSVQRDKVVAMLIIFAFNVLFWMFFEQAGSSFTFLADNIVDRGFGDWTFPTAWFQSVNSVAIITLAPVLAWLWVRLSRISSGSTGVMIVVRQAIAVLAMAVTIMATYRFSQMGVMLGVMPPWLFWTVVAFIVALGGRAILIDMANTVGTMNPSIPRKFGLGLIFNGLAFALLMFALSSLVSDDGKIPFWTLFMVYVIQSVGELCLSPIGLSMVTKLAPVRLVGFGMGGWFLSTGIGNNLSGIFAGAVSGESGMTTESALSGYTFGFWALIGAGALLFLIAPLIQKLMHGVK